MNGRRSLPVRIARLVQNLPLAWLRIFETPLIHVRTAHLVRPRLLILLALPRSGSTVTYQCLIHALKPVYLSNLWNLLYSLPFLGGYLTTRLCADHRSNFQSKHGFVEGLCGPAEGLRFWSYWSGCGLNEVQDIRMPDAVRIRRLAYLQRTLSLLTRPAKPLVTGYLGHTLAVGRLREWFPEAVFVRLHRDLLSNASSILRSLQSSKNDWFSVVPQECLEAQHGTPHMRVASQVYWLNRRLSALDNDARTIHVGYEDLCRDPEKEIRRVVDFANERGLQIDIQDTLPSNFIYRLVRPEDSDDAAALALALSDLERQHGPISAVQAT